jgi:hypothetical protein
MYPYQVQMRRPLALAATVLAFLLVSSSSLAGGSFERIVGVGARGVTRTIALRANGPRSDSVLYGRAVAVPAGAYVRLYPFIGDLPAVPGRFYPAAGVVCLYWHEPASNCMRLGSDGRSLLRAFASLPLRRERPTTVVAVWWRGSLMRRADGNVFAALELALERRPVARSARPHDAVALKVRWRGPRRKERPARLLLAPRGVYVAGRLYPLPREIWCFVGGGLSAAPASLVEATTRRCR